MEQISSFVALVNHENSVYSCSNYICYNYRISGVCIQNLKINGERFICMQSTICKVSDFEEIFARYYLQISSFYGPEFGRISSREGVGLPKDSSKNCVLQTCSQARIKIFQLYLPQWVKHPNLNQRVSFHQNCERKTKTRIFLTPKSSWIS